MKKQEKSEKIGVYGGFLREKGSLGGGFWGDKKQGFRRFRGVKGGYFEGFTLISGGFWVK